MVQAKKATAKKTTTVKKAKTKKPVAAKKAETTGRRARTARVSIPMSPEVRTAGAAALAAFEEKLLDEEGIGFDSATSKELKGSRSGYQKVVRMEDENGKRTQAIITVVYKERAPRKPRAPRAARRSRKATTTETDA